MLALGKILLSPGRKEGQGTRCLGRSYGIVVEVDNSLAGEGFSGEAFNADADYILRGKAESNSGTCQLEGQIVRGRTAVAYGAAGGLLPQP